MLLFSKYIFCLQVEVENLKIQLNEKLNVTEEKSAEVSTSWTNVCAENQAQQSAKLLLQQKIQEIQKINVEKQVFFYNNIIRK